MTKMHRKRKKIRNQIENKINAEHWNIDGEWKSFIDAVLLVINSSISEKAQQTVI